LFGLSTIGVSLFFLFFISLISISIYVSHTKEMTVESYFFANRNTHWLVLGISLLTGCLFSPYIFGWTSSGLTSGSAIVYGIISAIMLIILGWFLAPLYLKIKINTLPEYFEKRFNRTCKLFLSALYIFYNIFIRLMIILVAGSIFIFGITGTDAYSSLFFFLFVTGIYIIIGGLKAEIYINIVQVFFITLGIAGFLGWIITQGEGVPLAIYKIASLSGGANSEFTWFGLIIGLPIIGFWFWCADQFMVQKVMSVRNIYFLKKATVLSLILQIIPILIFILPGIIIISFFQGVASEDSLRSFFSSGILPESIKGGLIIAVAAILMASFASLFNSTSILITFDFYKTFKPDASDRKLVLVGRLTTMILLFCSILLIPVSQAMSFSFCLKLFNTFSYFASMIAAVFIIGLLNEKINAVSALTTLCIGTLIILLRISFELIFGNPFTNNLLSWFTQSNFLEFSALIFLISVLSLFVFNRVVRIQNAANFSLKFLKQIFLRLKYEWNFHRTVFLILFVLLLIVVWGGIILI